MATYSELLESAMEEEKFANESFSSLSSYLESVTSFVNEEVNFEVTISLNEAENESIKDKAGKIGAAVKKAIDKLIAKLQEFIAKIKEAIKRLVSKAKLTISQNGNKAMSKMLANNDYKIGKDIKLSNIKGGASGVQKLFEAGVVKAGQALKDTRDLAQMIADGESAELATAIDTAIVDVFSSSVVNSDAMETVEIKAADGKSVKDAYKPYVGDYFDCIKKYLPALQSTTDDAQKKANEIIKGLKKCKDADAKEVNSAAIQAVSSYSSNVMKLSMNAVNYAADVLTVATKNSAKIALAAVDASGKAAAAKAKEIPGKVKNAAKAAPGEAKVKAQLAKQEVKSKLGK